MTNNRYWIYLERLRRSGVVNMYGAGPYLEQRFLLNKQTAHNILLDWMKKYDPEDYKELDK